MCNLAGEIWYLVQQCLDYWWCRVCQAVSRRHLGQVQGCKLHLPSYLWIYNRICSVEGEIWLRYIDFAGWEGSIWWGWEEERGGGTLFAHIFCHKKVFKVQFICPWQFKMLKSISSMLLVFVLISLLLLTLEFNSLPGSKGRSSWFWCKSTSKLIFGNYETAMFTVVLILPIFFSGWGWRWWRWRWSRWRFWCWIQGWKQRRCWGWNQGRWETCRVSFLLMKLYHFCFVLNCVLIFFLVLYVCRMNCKGLEGSGHKGWAWSGPKNFFLVYF